MSQGASVEDVIGTIRAVYGRWTRATSIAAMREDWDALFAPRAAPWPQHCVDAGGVPAEWIAPPDIRASRTILYLHGGGFRLGSIDSHRDLMQRLALATNARILAVAYRLCPEHRFPAALTDATQAWNWLSSTDDGPLCIAGDSAGAGLAVGTMLAARERGMPMPDAAFLMSPWVDLAATGASYVTQAASDPMHQRRMIVAMAKDYLGAEADLRNPEASPLYADLSGLPPLLIQCGGRDVILDDAREFARRARDAGAQVSLQIYDAMIHVFQMFGELAEAQDALNDAGVFLSRKAAGQGNIIRGETNASARDAEGHQP